MIKILITVLLIIQQFENKITILVHKKYVKDNNLLLDICDTYRKIYSESVDIIPFAKESMLVRNIDLVKQADLVIGVSDLFLEKFAECNPAKVSSLIPNKSYAVYTRQVKNFIKYDRFIPIGFCDISLIANTDKSLQNLDISVFNPLLSTTGMYILYFIENNMSRKVKNILLSKLSDTIFFAPNWAEAFFKFFNRQHNAVITCFMDQFNTLDDTINGQTIPVKNTYLNRILGQKKLYITNIFYKRPLYVEYLFANTQKGLRILPMLFHPINMPKLQKTTYLESATKLDSVKNAAIMNSAEFWKKRKLYINNL